MLITCYKTKGKGENIPFFLAKLKTMMEEILLKEIYTDITIYEEEFEKVRIMFYREFDKFIM